MGMPKIIGSNISREQAITDIIESIALEEAAIAHIENAEGKKLQTVLKLDPNISEIHKTNKSINDMVNSLSNLELVLISKLKLFDGALEPVLPVSFSFSKLDFHLKTGITGAKFGLLDNDSESEEPIATAVSNDGIVTFDGIYDGKYILYEIQPAAGYIKNELTYMVLVTKQGDVTIDKKPPSEIVFYNQKPIN